MKVWDLRQFQQGTPVATFKHHTEPITSVEWHPEDSTVLAASGADNQVSNTISFPKIEHVKMSTSRAQIDIFHTQKKIQQTFPYTLQT